MTADERAETPERRPDWLPPLLTLAHMVLVWLSRAPAMATRQDDARYLVLARALREGTYRDLLWPGAPLHHMYPPGYPLLLAVWTAVGGERFAWLALLQVLLSGATIWLMYLAARASLGRPVALAALSLLAVNPSLIEWSGQVASEGSLAICFAIAIWAAQTMPAGRKQLIVVVAAALAAPQMRTAGIVLPAAVFVWWLLEHRYRDAVVLGALSGLSVGALLWWTLTDPSAVAGSSYAADLVRNSGHGASASAKSTFVTELLQRFTNNLAYYPARGIPWLLAMPTIEGTIVDNVLVAGGVGLAVLVGLLKAWRQMTLAALVVLATVGLLLVWPYQENRYLVPLLPVLLPVLTLGVASVANAVRPRAGNIALAVIVLLAGGTGLARSLAAVQQSANCTQQQQKMAYNCLSVDQASFYRAAAFVRDSLPRGARVLSAKSEPLFVFSSKLTVPYAPMVSLDSAAFWESLRRDSTDYILLSALQAAEPARLAVRLAQRCRDLSLVHAFPPRTYLFRLAPQPGDSLSIAARGQVTAGASSPACESIKSYRATEVTP